MRGVVAKAAFVTVALAATAGLGLASAHRTFAWVRGEANDGRSFELREGGGEASSERELVVGGEGERVVVSLPADARPADRLAVAVTLIDGAGAHPGTGTFQVDEADGFLGGTLDADVGGFALHGGLRVRAPAPRAPVEADARTFQ